jgi:CheY-like chemotaxis protein
MKLPRNQVLIVDDDSALLAVLKLTMEEICSHCRVKTAGNGHAALNVLNQHNIKLVLTDYNMPGMNGLELATQIRDRWPEIPLVLMTASGDSSELRAAVSSLGKSDFVQKPFGVNQLRQILQSVPQEGIPC